MNRSVTAHLILTPLLLLTSCSDVVIYERPTYDRTDFTTPEKPEVFQETVDAPWQAWRADDRGDERMHEADVAARSGEFEKAISIYDSLWNSSASDAIRDEALTRKFGTMLKLGRSKAVLTELSRYVQTTGKGNEKVGPEKSLIAAFSYEHQRDLDQTLAWLGVAFRASGGAGEAGRRAREQARYLFRRVQSESFESYASKWAGDSFISSMVSEERGRRAVGGKVDERPEKDWFRAEAYLPGAASGAELTEPMDMGVVGSSDLPPANVAVSVGVLLPLTGQYSEHAERVKRGIELAISMIAPDGSVRAVYADTKGEELTAVGEYERLVRDERVAAVLGPLLVKEAEGVANRSRLLHVPFLTFTKRAGITELSDVALRLGATAEDQVQELLNYVVDTLQVKSAAIVAADTKEEMLAAFKKAATLRGINITSTEVISPLQEESLREALGHLGASHPDMVFFVDPIDRIADFLKLLKASDLAHVKLCGTASWNDPVMIRGYGPLLEGAVFVSPFFAASARPEVAQFVEQYSTRFSDRAELLSAQAYDGAKLVLERLLADPTQGALRLREPATEEGITGRLEISPNGEIHRSMSVIEIRGGQGVELAVAGVPTGAIGQEETHGE